MAAYFGESEWNQLNMLNAESPLPDVANLNHNASTPKASWLGRDCHDAPNRICRDSGLPCKSPMSAYFDGDDGFSMMSPESDLTTSGSESDVSASTESTYIDSLSGSNGMTSLAGGNYIASSPSTSLGSPMVVQLVSPCFVACNVAPLASQDPSFNLPSQSASQTQSSRKSALRVAPKNTGRRVAWSEEVVEVEEVTQKVSLCLSDQLNMSILKVGCLNASPLAQRVWQLSQDAQGTFVVQKALDDCSNDEQRGMLAVELSGHVFEATQCPHANHVLRKVISVLSPASLNFVVSELMNQGQSGIVDLARHPYGCRILEGLLEHCPLEQLHSIVLSLLADPTALCTHMYGNFVMQRLLVHAALRGHLLQVIRANLVVMGTNFFGATVIVKAMSHGNESERLVLARAILDVRGLLAAIAGHRHGKPIAELVPAVLEGVEKEAAVKQLDASPLKMPRSGRGC